jgi:hypothetical protein
VAEIVTRLWREAFNAGALDVLPELVHEEFVNFGKTTNGPEFLRSLISAQRGASPTCTLRRYRCSPPTTG